MFVGLGMVTPLGCGVETTWKKLNEGECGIRKLVIDDLKLDGFDADTRAHVYDQLTSKVAAIVPSGNQHGQYNEDLWIKVHVPDYYYLPYLFACNTSQITLSNVNAYSQPLISPSKNDIKLIH